MNPPQLLESPQISAARRSQSSRVLVALLLPLVSLSACGESASDSADQAGTGTAVATLIPAEERGALPEGAEAWSMTGEALYPTALAENVAAVYQTNLEAAQADFDADPNDVDNIVWLGRRLAYPGRYREAIAAYTRGIELHPTDARLYRHRGHRYLSVREFDNAIADFQSAVQLIEGTEDQVEPDGLPNAAGIPTSTLHFNIWYHLGLAHYLKGEHEQALLAWNACLEASRHPDSVVATTYWLNNTLRRIGMTGQADELLEGIDADMGIIESTAYLNVLLLHKGVRTLDEVMPETAEVSLESTTTSYGVGMWHMLNGREERAFEIFQGVVGGGGSWSPFGFIAAEAELARR